MEIVLLRHGKVDTSFPGKVRAHELHRWIEVYNQAGIDPQVKPTERTLQAISDCACVVSSDLARSITSAQLLQIDMDAINTDPIFREAGLPYANWRSFSLPPHVWAALFRILWYFGFSANSESIDSARIRARQCAARLSILAQEHGVVLLVGHGIMNRLIGKALLRDGWIGPKSPGVSHWSSAVYRYHPMQ